MSSLPVLPSLHKFNSTATTIVTVLLDKLKLEGVPNARSILPTVFKYIFYFLLLINARSLPLAWHFRVFRPVFAIRFRHRLLKWRTMFLSRAAQDIEEDKWLDSICPVGEHPLDKVVSYTSWASIDDSDFNGHLSNSSYAKTYDAARFKAALQMFPMFFRAGGWMALAATHYNFIREIPMFSSYEVRLTLHGWDQKWLYVVAKFVSKPKHEKSRTKATVSSLPNSGSATPSGSTTNPNTDTEESPFTASLRQPGPDELSTVPTPSGNIPKPESTKNALSAVSRDLSSSQGLDLAGLTKSVSKSSTEPDGAVLHTVAVSQLCFKIGRITVPPSVVLAVNGFTREPGYSCISPPPSFVKAKQLMSRPMGGNTKKLREFLKGGWKNLGEKGEEEWWVEPLAGELDERRRKGLEAMESLRRGVEGARVQP
ncbi:hypothetical protein AMATHDRAFT_5480 [Amanita thiersii Skay4041]|uniref:Thioesterase domain-containing protein n=1 Tax=Amanita thiersii Skay4041 TaxID=703135 RepID=A0A2A9NKK4_9AGAR|nr:hypothetical protein AMATHDRAFT_5480 [Amanita thiersii Skay4041]